MATHKDSAGWRPRTIAVRGGQERTPFQETSEALFLTSGYAYEGPEEPEERFQGAAGYTYTRYANPTVSMFERRMALLEGRRSGMRHRVGHGGGDRDLVVLSARGRSCGRGQGIVRRHPFRHRRIVAALGHRRVDGRRCRPRSMARCDAAQHQTRLRRDAGQPDARDRRHQGRRRHRACGGRAPRGRQRLCLAGVAAADGFRRRHRGAFVDQIHRRSGPRAGRHDPVRREISDGSSASVRAQHGARASVRSMPGCI